MRIKAKAMVSTEEEKKKCESNGGLISVIGFNRIWGKYCPPPLKKPGLYSR
jgi:hypothetical protein